MTDHERYMRALCKATGRSEDAWETITGTMYIHPKELMHLCKLIEQEQNAHIHKLESQLQTIRDMQPCAWAILDEYGMVDGGLSDGRLPPFPADPETGLQNWSPLVACSDALQ